MRIRCHILGCDSGYEHACVYCGAALYDADFIQAGWQWVVRLGYALRRLRKRVKGAHCAVCKRHFWPKDQYEFCCGRKCQDQWIPF